MPHDIFVCYSRSDREFADKVVQRLGLHGWSVFQDVNTHVGRRWHKEIERELHAARAVVVLWSATSRDSDFVLEEAEYGKRNDILFPAFIERVEFPYGFGRIQTADLVGWGGEEGHPGFDQLLQSLSLQLGGGKTAQVTSPADAGSETYSAAGLIFRDKLTRQRGWGETAQIALSADAGSEGFPTVETTFRDKLKDGGEGPLMVAVPAGRYLMGSPPDEPQRVNCEGPQHEVHIARPFDMGVYAVTFDDYDRFTTATGARQPFDESWGRGSRPVINVSWLDAQAYCGWLCAQSGHGYRLPSEAEWEYACRACTATPFHFGASLSVGLANFDGSFTDKGSSMGEFRGKTLPVGSFAPNAFGLHDMHGNVWEWCLDEWHADYDGAPQDGSEWEGESNGARVLRGGSWFNVPRLCRAAHRFSHLPDYHSNVIGFRVCRAPPNQSAAEH